LNQLRKVLGLETEAIGALRYQLFHRAASALLEAERFGAQNAILLVQSFESDPDSFTAFIDFGNILGCRCADCAIVEGPLLGRVVCLRQACKPQKSPDTTFIGGLSTIEATAGLR
jgi:hypothetical protein